MPKTTLRCGVCQNKVGESENGITTFRHKGRTVCVESGMYPCVVTVGCETCKSKTVFEICSKEVVCSTTKPHIPEVFLDFVRKKCYEGVER